MNNHNKKSSDNEVQLSCDFESHSSNPTPLQQPIDESFDFDSISLSTDFRSTHQIKRPLTHVPIRKPAKQTFFRTHPDTSWWSHTKVLELHDDLREGYVRETYMVARHLWEVVEAKEPLAERILVPYITRNGDVLVWPIKVQEQGSRAYSWTRGGIRAKTYGFEISLYIINPYRRQIVLKAGVGIESTTNTDDFLRCMTWRKGLNFLGCICLK